MTLGDREHTLAVNAHFGARQLCRSYSPSAERSDGVVGAQARICDTARVVGCSPEAAKKRFQRAAERLRGDLEVLLPVEPDERQVLDLVARADPLPDPDALLDNDQLDAIRRLVKERSTIVQPRIETTERIDTISPTGEPPEAGPASGDGRRPRRLLPVAAVVSGVAAAILLIAWVSGAFEDASTEIDTVDQPEPPEAPDDGAAADADLAQFEAEGLAAAEAYVAAFEAGDVDTLMVLSAPGSSGPGDLHMFEFHAVTVEAGSPVLAGDCEVTTASLTLVLVDCVQTLTDPVFVALGQQDVVHPLEYRGDGLTWRPWRGADVSQANAAYADYLQSRQPAEYAESCGPIAHDSRTVVMDSGFVLTADCARLAVSVASDTAEWVRDGCPES